MTVTLNIPPPPEGYGPDCHYGALPDGEIVIYFGRGRWGLQPQFEGGTGIYAFPIKPWYPPSWYEPDGKLLPDVYEHTPGDWPKHAKPGDVIAPLHKSWRADKRDPYDRFAAHDVRWGYVVAYRVISRVQS